MQPNGFDIFKAAQSITANLAYFLPRNTNVDQVIIKVFNLKNNCFLIFDLLQLIELATGDGKAEIEQNILNNKVKTLTAYYGELIVDPE
jgi:hypothetical protein